MTILLNQKISIFFKLCPNPIPKIAPYHTNYVFHTDMLYCNDILLQCSVMFILYIIYMLYFPIFYCFNYCNFYCMLM